MKHLVVLMLLVSLACTKARTEETRYKLTGLVIGTDRGAERVIIAHDEIKGFMPAMTMPYKITDRSPALNPGERVTATLVVTKDTGWLEDVAVTKKADAAFVSGPVVPSAAGIGTEVPDFLLRNQDDQPIHLRQFRGSVVMLTFIYTRCPFPDFCPLMMRNFNEVKRGLALDPDIARRVHLLSVSLDNEYDTPAVLRAYGEKSIAGADRFERWDLATAAAAQIRPMAAYFGVSYRDENGQINHSLSTAIIGADGRLVEWLPDNTWHASDAIVALRRAVEDMPGPGISK